MVSAPGTWCPTQIAYPAYEYRSYRTDRTQGTLASDLKGAGARYICSLHMKSLFAKTDNSFVFLIFKNHVFFIMLSCFY